MPSEKNFYSIEDIEELAESILDCGLLEYPRVKDADNSGQFEIISGHRRYHACMHLVGQGYEEYKKIPCHIDGCIDPDLMELKIISANAQARVLTDSERVKQASTLERLYKKLKDRGVPIKGRIRDRIAKQTGVSPAQVSRYESINKKLIPDLRGKFDEGNLSVTDAYDFSTIPAKEQAERAEYFKQTGELKNPKKEARREPRQPAKVKDETGPQKNAAPKKVDIPAQTKTDDTGKGRIITCPCCHKDFILPD